MKRLFKIFLIILSFMFLTACSFSKEQATKPDDYKPIPESMSKQYKQEMEQIIEEEYPKVIKKIDGYVDEIKILHDKIKKNGYNLDDYIQMSLIPDTCISSADLELYVKLMQITQEKYLATKYTPISTDTPNSISDFLQPYFEDNHVNTRKLAKIINYEYKNIQNAQIYIKNIENRKNFNKIDIMISNKIRDLDNYNPVPENLQNIYIKQISSNSIVNYKSDMNKALKHILQDKITYNNKTLLQMLLDFNNKSDKIYLKYMNNPNNYEQNKLFVDQLRQINGTISLYPDAIIEQFQPYIEKYDLRLVPGSENDIFLYKYYIEKYDIKYSNEFKKLLKLKEYVYLKTDIYISEISNEF